MYMGVRKPLEKAKVEVDVDALIDGGAKVKEDFKREESEWKVINVRISTEMLKAVDNSVQKGVGLTRTGWILQAIHEKLIEKSSD
jgi:predicted DNA binding CopG/RHH family protein